jgi:glycosyltransferase involved in cell wall biosynthesis
MAVFPYFVLGPNTILSLFGLLRGVRKKSPPPAEGWRHATVDVVIPAYNEENTIILCLESLRRQTLKPHRVILIDDGSKDRTAAIAREFAAANDMPLEVIRHRRSVGKTHGLKQEARELDGDVEFVLDGDTVLESENYLERLIEELYRETGIASACGVVLPLREKDRHWMAAGARVRKFYQKKPELSYLHDRTPFHRLMRGITNIYRDFLYYFLQSFIYPGYMSLFGSIVNPVGCAVAYRREYIKDLFNQYEGTLGDNLTTSEDIFIGFAMLENGYRNIQVRDVITRSEEPEAQSVPHQIFMWSSAFLQSCYYFPDLLASPFKVFRSMEPRGAEGKGNARKKPDGVEYTRKYGRPIGWAILLALVEKIGFPLAVLLLAVFGHWEALAFTLTSETLLILLITAVLSEKASRVEYLLKAVIATPIRYMVMMYDLPVAARFLTDIAFSKKPRWRK